MIDGVRSSSTEGIRKRKGMAQAEISEQLRGARKTLKEALSSPHRTKGQGH